MMCVGYVIFVGCGGSWGIGAPRCPSPNSPTLPMIGTLRHRLICLPARLVRLAVALDLRLPPGYPLIEEVLARLRASPQCSYQAKRSQYTAETRSPEATLGPSAHPKSAARPQKINVSRWRSTHLLLAESGQRGCQMILSRPLLRNKVAAATQLSPSSTAGLSAAARAALWSNSAYPRLFPR